MTPATDVRSICAIGRRGQLGLNGLLPWEGAKGAEYVADVERFFEVTRGHVLVAGPKTIAAVPRFAYVDRTIEVIRSGDRPEDVIARHRSLLQGGGGACGRRPHSRCPERRQGTGMLMRQRRHAALPARERGPKNAGAAPALPQGRSRGRGSMHAAADPAPRVRRRCDCRGRDQ